jgi:signal transduction histidine kinase
MEGGAAREQSPIHPRAVRVMTLVVGVAGGLTTLTGLVVLATWGLEAPSIGRFRAALGLMKANSAGAFVLIDDILDFSKIDAGKLRLETIPFRTRACLRQPLRGLAGCWRRTTPSTARSRCGSSSARATT